jgi:hypothetical protein
MPCRRPSGWHAALSMICSSSSRPNTRSAEFIVADLHVCSAKNSLGVAHEVELELLLLVRRLPRGFDRHCGFALRNLGFAL